MASEVVHQSAPKNDKSKNVYGRYTCQTPAVLPCTFGYHLLSSTFQNLVLILMLFTFLVANYCQITRKTCIPGACFRAANVFSFEALFANNPFWIPQPETHFKFSVRKTQPSYGLGYRKCNQIQDGGEDFILLQ